MRTDVQAGHTDSGVKRHKKFSGSLIILALAAGFGFSTNSYAAAADLVSQIESLNGVCGADVLGNTFGNCSAGDISVSDVVNVQFEGDPTSCVSGDPLTISQATVQYTMKTGTRQDLIMWIGDQEGTDPRLYSGAGQTCSAYSLPSPFTDSPTTSNPFGDNDGDQCGDISLSVTSAERTFTGLTFNCQDNDQDGLADAQILLTWDQNAQTACGTGLNQTFPIVGARSKCDYTVQNTTTITVVYPPILTLVKEVTNNNGGLATPANWILEAVGPTAGISGATGTGGVTDVVVEAGDYLLGETGPAGYDGTWECDGGTLVGDTVTLENFAGIPGDPGAAARTITCTLTNDDQPASLTLQKIVTNNSGGSAETTDWTLTASGPTPLEGAGGASSATMSAGEYTLNEIGGPVGGGYTAGAWSCEDAQGAISATPLNLVNGAVVTCTITNDDDPATLTLVKEIVNNSGGGITDVDTWDLTATGTGDNNTPITGDTTTFWNGGVSVNADTYTLSESTVPGYAQLGQWVCTGGVQNGNQITVANGQSASCRVTNDDQPATLTLAKTVTNDFGGDAVIDDWDLTASGTVVYSGDTSTYWTGGRSVNAGSYALSETGPSGYTEGTWSCSDSQGAVASDPLVISAGQAVSCTINNTAQAPSLTLIKDVQGGSAATGDFDLHVTGNDGAAGTCGQNGSATYNDTTGSGVAVTPLVSNCTYSITEDAESGYSLTNIACVDNNSGAGVGTQGVFSLNEGQAVTCTVTNTAVTTGSITVVKRVNNDNGGTLGVTAFPLQVVGTTVGGEESCTFDSSDQQSPYVHTPSLGTPCDYTITETEQPGYTQDSIVCQEAGGEVPGVTEDGTFRFNSGETWLCTITNSDQPATLTLVKDVTTNSGGSAGADEWTLRADGDNDYSGTTSEWAGGVSVDAGVYTLSEVNGPDGYSPGTWSCETTPQPIPGRAGGSAAPSKPMFDLTGDQLTLGLGEDVTCTITNDDIPGNLTLIKEVINLDGGDAVPNDWTLTATGTDTYSGLAIDYWDGGVEVNAGVYELSESGGPDGGGYTAGDWTCTPAEALTGTRLTVGLEQNVVCRITNDDIPPVLTLWKEVVNDNGGEVTAAAFQLTLQGIDGEHDSAKTYGDGSQPDVKANVDYTVDEIELDGYSLESVVCLDGDAEVSSEPLTLALGQNVSCTVNNDDIAPTLTLVKSLLNDNGGLLTEDDFVLTLTGDDSGFDGSADHSAGQDYKDGDTPLVFASVSYTVSEDTVPEGYEVTGIACVDSDTQAEIQNGFTPLLGQNIVCTVSNDDLQQDLRILVTKYFTDTNPGKVTVFLSCNSGLILEQDFDLGHEEFVLFVVEEFKDEDGFYCEVTESGAEGYVGSFVANGAAAKPTSCYFAAGEEGNMVDDGDNTCVITNTPDVVDVTVGKDWIVTGSGGAEIDLDIYVEVMSEGKILGGTECGEGYWCETLYFNGESPDDQVVEVQPEYAGTTVYLTEGGADQYAEAESTCGTGTTGSVEIKPAAPASCVFTNTVFFEGIPSLNQYGLALLALLMLGIGVIGVRRLA